MPYYSITSNTNDISAGVKKRFSPHRDRKHKQKKMDTSQTIQTKIKMMTQKRKLTKYEENNYPKEKRKNSIKQSEKKVCCPKKV